MDHIPPLYAPIGYGDPAATLRVRRSLIWATVLTAIPAVADLFFRSLNPSMTYVIPLLIVSKAGQRRLVVRFAVIQIILTYVLYVHHFWPEALHNPGVLVAWRLLNRSMSAFAIIVVAGALYLWLGVQERLFAARVGQIDTTAFDELAESLKNLIGFLVSVLLIICISIADFATPGQINFPILYAIPLMIAHWMGSRRQLWILLPILILMSNLGYSFGKVPEVTPDRLVYVIVNRTMAMTALVVIAVVLHFLIRPGLENEKTV